MDWWNLQLGAYEVAMGLQWARYDSSIIQSNETRVIRIISIREI